jgi:3-methyladenine DNA glycosylase AlkC
MAEPLKNKYGPEVPRRIGTMLAAAWPGFPTRAFLADALAGYDALELMPRARQVATAMHRHLPADYPRAITILLDSLGPRAPHTADLGLGSFLYLPHVFFVAAHGLGHFEESMRAQYELTQPLHGGVQHPRLSRAASRGDPRAPRAVERGSRRARAAPGVRRHAPTAALGAAAARVPARSGAGAGAARAAEGRSRAVRAALGGQQPQRHRQGPSRRCWSRSRRWMRGATPQRRWIVGHALRSAIKRADPGALAVMGFGSGHDPGEARRRHDRSRRGRGSASSVTVGFELHNASRQPQRVLADLRVHFVKSSAVTGAKVFKLKARHARARRERRAAQEDQPRAADDAQALRGAAPRRGAVER